MFVYIFIDAATHHALGNPQMQVWARRDCLLSLTVSFTASFTKSSTVPYMSDSIFSDLFPIFSDKVLYNMWLNLYIFHLYSPEDGTHSEATFTQSSKLALTSAQLVALKAVADTVTFTCSYYVGDTNTPVTATQTINLFTPSKYIPVTATQTINLFTRSKQVPA